MGAVPPLSRQQSRAASATEKPMSTVEFCSPHAQLYPDTLAVTNSWAYTGDHDLAGIEVHSCCCCWCGDGGGGAAVMLLLCWWFLRLLGAAAAVMPPTAAAFVAASPLHDPLAAACCACHASCVQFALPTHCVTKVCFSQPTKRNEPCRWAGSTPRAAWSPSTSAATKRCEEGSKPRAGRRWVGWALLWRSVGWRL